MRLILYSKPGCHLCEGLQEKLEQIHSLDFELEVRDITTRDDWFQAYQYEIPVLHLAPDANSLDVNVPNPNVPDAGDPELGDPELGDPAAATRPDAAVALIPLPRLSPRASVYQVEQMLQKYLGQNSSQ